MNNNLRLHLLAKLDKIAESIEEVLKALDENEEENQIEGDRFNRAYGQLFSAIVLVQGVAGADFDKDSSLI